ncbi:MAG: hypothetical protein WC220_11385 [Pedobacter sp.]|jgi:hypothetical protein
MKPIKYLFLGFIILSALSVIAQPKEKAAKPYQVYEKGTYMTNISVRKEVRGTENVVQIEALNVSGGTALVRGGILPAADIQEVIPTQGNYNLTRQISNSGRGETIQLMDVVFPVRLRIAISGQYLDVEIKEAGFWKIAVGLTQ